MAAATLFLGLIEGVSRPGIAIAYKTLKGIALIIDVGANIDTKPQHLLEYAVMASVYAESVLGIESPSIGLLNIGEEESKGTSFIKEAHSLLEESGLNFAGNIEGKDLFKGACDCLICDGFSGNITLKVAEGTMEAMAKFLVEELKKGFLSRIGLLLAKRSFYNFYRTIDYSSYGGAPLLGVGGIVIIGHGRSKAMAVKNAIKSAAKEVKQKITIKIKEGINAVS